MDSGEKDFNADLENGSTSSEDEKVELLLESGNHGERHDFQEHLHSEQDPKIPNAKKAKSKRPSKPPRPPKSPLLLDIADQKLVQELSEIAMRKKARQERVKTLRKMKASKRNYSSSTVSAIIITALFFLIIVFQGISSRNASSFDGFTGQSSVKGGSLIAVHNWPDTAAFSMEDESPSSSPASVTQEDGFRMPH